MNYYIGVDIGTSSLKIIVGEEGGTIMDMASSPYSLHSEKEGYSEQNPEEWIKAFEQTFSTLLQRNPSIRRAHLTLSFSGQMHSLVLLNQGGKPLRNAILWNDTRTTKQVDLLNNTFKKHLLEVEKNIAIEGFTLPKILWIMENEPDIWQKTWKFLLPKDYVRYFLTGAIGTDPSDAAGTIMYDIANNCWDQPLLDLLHIPVEICPKVISSTELVGQLKPELQTKYGLIHPVAIVTGGADNACGALGTISDIKHQGLLSVGTSGVVLSYDEKKDIVPDGTYHYFHSTINKLPYKMGVTLSAGYSLNWLKKILAPNTTYEAFTKEMKQIPIGSNGVLFTPYLFGERTPFFNAHMYSGFTHLHAHHGRGELIRSVMEGIIFSLKNTFHSMYAKKEDVIQKFRVTGGITQNEDWLQMTADVFNKEIEVLTLDEGPAFGAMMCAILSTSKEEATVILEKFNKVKRTFYPVEENVQAYEAYFQKFVDLSEAIHHQSVEK